MMVLLHGIGPNTSLRKDMMVGLALSGLVLFKWSGLIIVPVVVFYYLVCLKELSLRKRLLKLATCLSLVGALLLFLTVVVHMQPVLSAVKGRFFKQSFWYYFLKLPSQCTIPELILFFIGGLVVLRFRDLKARAILYLWILVWLLAISLAKEKVFQYMLPVIPAILITIAIGIEGIIKLSNSAKRLRVFQALIFLILVACCIKAYFFNERVWNGQRNTWVGFYQAGQWLKENAGENDLVMAGAPRAIRYCSGMNLKQHGGQITAVPGSFEDAERLAKESGGRVWLVFDQWEYTQPSWIYPIDEEKIKKLEERNWRPVHVVRTAHFTWAPVIIFEYTQTQ